MGVFLVFLILGIISAVVIIIGRVVDYNGNDGEVYYWVGGIACGCAVIAMLVCGMVALIIGCQRQVKY